MLATCTGVTPGSKAPCTHTRGPSIRVRGVDPGSTVPAWAPGGSRNSNGGSGSTGHAA